jgi:dephospho-CoA kinase
MTRPFVIGVTGGIACGKSTVLRVLTELGAETIDADTVYHRLIEPGSPLWQTLVDRFGERILDESGAIDRRALAATVFADASALSDLDRLTHPAVNDEIRRLIARSTAATIAVDAVKLVESGFDADCDQVWLVTCDRDQQIDRLVARNRLAPADAARRVGAQPPSPARAARADVLIDNSRDLATTEAQVRAAWNALPPRGNARTASPVRDSVAAAVRPRQGGT